MSNYAPVTASQSSSFIPLPAEPEHRVAPYPPFAHSSGVTDDDVAAWIMALASDLSELVMEWYALYTGEDLSRRFFALYGLLRDAAMHVADLNEWLRTPIDLDAPNCNFRFDAASQRAKLDRMRCYELEIQPRSWTPEDDLDENGDPIEWEKDANWPPTRTRAEYAAAIVPGRTPRELITEAHWAALNEYLLTLNRIDFRPSHWGNAWTLNWSSITAPLFLDDHDDIPPPLYGDDDWELLPRAEQDAVEKELNERFPYPTRPEDPELSTARVFERLQQRSGLDTDRFAALVGVNADLTLPDVTLADIKPQVDAMNDEYRDEHPQLMQPVEDCYLSIAGDRLAWASAMVQFVWERTNLPLTDWWRTADGERAYRAGMNGYWLDFVGELITWPCRFPPQIKWEATENPFDNPVGWTVCVYELDSTPSESHLHWLTDSDCPEQLLVTNPNRVHPNNALAGEQYLSMSLWLDPNGCTWDGTAIAVTRTAATKE